MVVLKPLSDFIAPDNIKRLNRNFIPYAEEEIKNLIEYEAYTPDELIDYDCKIDYNPATRVRTKSYFNEITGEVVVDKSTWDQFYKLSLDRVYKSVEQTLKSFLEEVNSFETLRIKQKLLLDKLDAEQIKFEEAEQPLLSEILRKNTIEALADIKQKIKAWDDIIEPQTIDIYNSARLNGKSLKFNGDFIKIWKLYKKLVSSQFLSADTTSLPTFRNFFSNGPIQKKIVWLGSDATLSFFFRSFFKKKFGMGKVRLP